MSDFYCVKFLMLLALFATYVPCKPSSQQPVTEIVHWQQPVCLAPGLNATFCSITERRRRQKIEFDSDERSSSEEIKTANKTLISKQVHEAIAIEQIDPSSFAGEELRERQDETPALGDDTRVHDFYVDEALQEIEDKVQTLMQVTKVVKSPTTATLVAQNCVLDVSVPLCDGYEDRLEHIDRLMRVQLQLSVDDDGGNVITESSTEESSAEIVVDVYRNVAEHMSPKIVVGVLNVNAMNVENAIADVAWNLVRLESEMLDFVIKHYGVEREFVVKALTESMLKEIENKKAVHGNVTSAYKSVAPHFNKNKLFISDATQNVAEKKMDVVLDFAANTPDLVKSTIKTAQDVAEQLQAVVQQKKEAALAEKQLLGSKNQHQQMIESVVTDFLQSNNDLSMQLANMHLEAMQNVTEKAITAIKGVADAVQIAVQQIADTKVQIIKAVSERTQEMIDSASLVTQQGFGEKEATAAVGSINEEGDFADFEYATTAEAFTKEKFDHRDIGDFANESKVFLDVDEVKKNNFEVETGEGVEKQPDVLAEKLVSDQTVEVTHELDEYTETLPKSISSESSDKASTSLSNSTTEAYKEEEETLNIAPTATIDQSSTERHDAVVAVPAPPAVAPTVGEADNIKIDFDDFHILPPHTGSKFLKDYNSTRIAIHEKAMMNKQKSSELVPTATTAAPSTTPVAPVTAQPAAVDNKPTCPYSEFATMDEFMQNVIRSDPGPSPSSEDREKAAARDEKSTTINGRIWMRVELEDANNNAKTYLADEAITSTAAVGDSNIEAERKVDVGIEETTTENKAEVADVGEATTVVSQIEISGKRPVFPAVK